MPERVWLFPAASERVDYYHFGDALAELDNFTQQFEGRQVIDLRTAKVYLQNRRLPADRAEALVDVLTFLTGPKGRRVGAEKLARALRQGRCWRQRFQALGCRGFSFRLSTTPRFSGCLCQENTLHVALLTEPDLYYPPGVRHALERLSWRTMQQDHVPGAVGWMLGQEGRADGRTWWYVTNVQSDLTSNAASCLREIFRGWQRVLFWLLLGLARRRGVTMIALPPAACLADSSTAGGKRLAAWRPLYDGVASYFGLERQRSPQPINIQPMRFLKARWCSTFYAGEVEQLWDRWGPAACRTEFHGSHA
jgi:hypothetical protein